MIRTYHPFKLSHFLLFPSKAREVFCLLKKVVMPANREEIG
uniref:Uncharacterized protein n=1 Tax=Picea glauca TaxID=3330 RepID=A0A101M5E7_PICGL|nr:hypothetical protein ABT39_MTgene1038 [Picea glauca]